MRPLEFPKSLRLSFVFAVALLFLEIGQHSAVAIGDLAEGSVTHVAPGRLYLRTASGGQLVFWGGKPKVNRGDRVEAEGQWTPAKFKDALRSDWIRVRTSGPEASPQMLPIRGPWPAHWESDLVTVEARVLDSLKTDTEIWLYAVAKNRPFRSVMKILPGMVQAERVVPGSVVQLTGLCDLLPSEGQPDRAATDFQLLLRDWGDVKILARPNWWTTERLVGLLMGLVIVVAVGAAWVMLLRRRVESQTHAISEHVAQAAVHEDRQRIARELHDTLEQELTGLRFHLETASVQIESAPQAARAALLTATSLLARSQRETRETLLDLREDTHQPSGAVAFCDSVRERLEDRCEAAGAILTFSVHGDERSFGGRSMHHLFRIVTEAAANALKHGKASRIDVDLKFETEALRIEIRDDGVGCTSLQMSHPPSGHFGLRGMRERAAKFGGTLEIESSPGAGTSINLTIPYD